MRKIWEMIGRIIFGPTDAEKEERRDKLMELIKEGETLLANATGKEYDELEATIDGYRREHAWLSYELSDHEGLATHY